MCLVFVVRPSINVTLSGLEGFPLNRKYVSKNVPERLTLFASCRFIEGELRPIHLALCEDSSQITVEPELSSREINVSVMSLVNHVRVVQLAKVFSLASSLV